jgi:hypothetical protein
MWLHSYLVAVAVIALTIVTVVNDLLSDLCAVLGAL